MDPMIGTASPELAKALQRLGRSATLRNTACTSEMVIDRHPVLVAIKGVQAGEASDAEAFRRGAQFRVLIRVDAQTALSAGCPGGRELDLWIGRQEQALNVLLCSWGGKDAPLDPVRYRLRVVQTPRDTWDGWVTHMATKDRYRLSLWEIHERGRAAP